MPQASGTAHMNVRLSGSSATNNNSKHHKTWEGATTAVGSGHKAQQSQSLRSNGSRTKLMGGGSGGGSQATALHMYEQKILHNKAQLAADAPLMIGSPLKQQ